MTAEPVTAKGRATRARILSTAADLMFTHGVTATSIGDVKQAANVSASQLNHYFGDKHALVRAVIEHQTEAMLEGQRPLLDQLDSMRALRAWCDLIIADQEASGCEGGCALGSLAAELVDAHPDLRQDIAKGFARWREPIRAGLAAMRDRGELRAEADPEKLATSFLAALEGGTLLAQTERDTAPLAAALDTMMAYVAVLAAV
jgi:TetR/AcrR family transcriptional repressor of nem operon